MKASDFIKKKGSDKDKKGGNSFKKMEKAGKGDALLDWIGSHRGKKAEAK
jgi:hypothetical protein